MKDLNEKWVGPIEHCQILTERMIWAKNGPTIWKAERFVGRPVFYPVYKYRDYHSYSLISLILLKNSLKVNKRWVKNAAKSDFIYNSGNDTIDIDINRIGGPQKCIYKIKSKEEYARKIAGALVKDIADVEENHADYTNIILCGGMDSLNLLLLPWKNPVIVASASPNYVLVKKFVADNKLRFKTIELKDNNNSLLKYEILLNCCRANLEHFRWGYNLTELSKKMKYKAIYWKGQIGSQLKPHWKSAEINLLYHYLHRIFRVFQGKGEYRVRKILEKSNLTQKFYFLSIWQKGAMWQGSHMGFIRQLTDTLTLSAYHGAEVQSVVAQVDMKYAVNEDIRPLIGETLYGRKVIYPSRNPGPPKSSHRKGSSHFQPFADAINSIGIPIFG